MSLYRVSPGDRPLSSDVNQFVDALTGKAAVGAITLASQVEPPSDPPNVTVEAGGSLPPGTYKYAYTYLVGTRKSNGEMLFSGETTPSPVATVTVTDGMAHVTVTTPRLGLNQTIIAKRIYRSKADGSTLHLVATIPVEQASFIDTVADTELGAPPPTTNGTGTRLRLGCDPVSDDEAVTKQYVENYVNNTTENITSDVVNTILSSENTFTAKQTFAAGAQLGDANNDLIDVFGLIVPLNTHIKQVTQWDSTFTSKPKTIQIRDGSTVLATIEVTSRNSDGKPTQLKITQGTRTRYWHISWISGKEFPSSIIVT